MYFINFCFKSFEVISHAVENGAPMPDVGGGRDGFTDFILGNTFCKRVY